MATGDRGTVVLGVGSPLMGDDGLGLAALERLRGLGAPPPGLELLDGGTWGMSLLPAIEEADRLLILDAIHQGAAPGTVVELAQGAVPRYLGVRLSPHQTDLADVLALTELRGTGPRELVAIGAQPGRVEMGVGLSPAVEAALDAVIARAVERLRAWGFDLPGAAAAAHA
jgi:hydrogenase maturation protease